MIDPIRCPHSRDGVDPQMSQIEAESFLIIGYARYMDCYGIVRHTRFACVPGGDSVRHWAGKRVIVYNDYHEAD